VRVLRDASSAVSGMPDGAELYGRGLNYEIARDNDRARKTYLELISNKPTSEYVPFAYFAFGVLFEADAKTDPVKWQFAEQAFQEVVKYPGSRATLVAHLELGRVFLAEGDREKAEKELLVVQLAPVREPVVDCALEAKAEAARLVTETPKLGPQDEGPGAFE
jgi:hypothetical protein